MKTASPSVDATTLPGSASGPTGAGEGSCGLDERRVRALTGLLAATGGSRRAVSPVDGRPLADIPESNPDDVVEAFRRARQAQAEWVLTPMQERAAVLMRLHDLVVERREEILDVLCWEAGKARKDAYNEALHLALTARYYARTAARHLASRRVPGLVPALTRVDVHRVPLGVVGVISPWNYPFTLALCDALPALMAGNAVVAKPDAQTMLSALLALDLLREAGLPPDLCQMVSGPGPVVGTDLVQNADYVCFTGSSATGRLIGRQCAERLVGCSLELGGKNPILVLEDADLDRAADGAVRAAFSNAGQLCVSMERLYVADRVYDDFLGRFLEHTEAMTLGAGPGWEVDMGTLISQAQLDTVTRHVEDARSKGVRVLTGGRARPDLAPYFYEPTVLEGTTPDVACHAEESFGPVISVYRFSDEQEAVALANEGQYGLNASLYTRDTRRGRQLARQVRCGTVNVNEAFGATFGSIAAPMGGMRESGVGRRQGAEGILRYTEAQSVAVQRLVRFGPMPGMTNRQYAATMTWGMRLVARLGRT